MNQAKNIGGWALALLCLAAVCVLSAPSYCCYRIGWLADTLAYGRRAW